MRIGAHQALLHGEDEQLGAQNGPRVGALRTDPELEGSDRVAQRGRYPDLVGEPQLLYLVEEPVGPGEHPATVQLGGS